MTKSAYVFGDLSWPMPDLGLVAVWRAMSLDASRWDDWHGFVDGVGPGTIGAMVDDVSGRPALQLRLTETGVQLRARLEDVHEADWQRLAIAWRLAADLGASGEFAWCPCDRGPSDVAYRAVIHDYGSDWEQLTGARARAIEVMPGHDEVAALAPPRARELTAATLSDDELAQALEPALGPTAVASRVAPAAASAKPPARSAAKPAGKPPTAKKSGAKKAGKSAKKRRR
jgi:hypothetical protein